MEQRGYYAAVKDAKTKLSGEECARSMGQRTQINDVAMMDAQIKLRREECASGMGQWSNDAAMKDAQIKLSEGGSAGHTVASHPNVVILNAEITPSKEEYVQSMEEE